MKLVIKRIDASLPLPEYKTKGAVAFDIYSRDARIIKPKTTELLPSNLIVKLPKGFFLLIASRSSTHKKGLFMAHGVGILDQDYNGPKDEIFIPLYNFNDKKVLVERGERIAQGVLIPIQKAAWFETNNMKRRSRGGFGSTGKK